MWSDRMCQPQHGRCFSATFSSPPISEVLSFLAFTPNVFPHFYFIYLFLCIRDFCLLCHCMLSTSNCMVRTPARNTQIKIIQVELNKETIYRGVDRVW